MVLWLFYLLSWELGAITLKSKYFFLRQSWFKQQKAKKPFTGVIVTLGVTVLHKRFDGMITFNIFWYLFKISQLASSMEQIIQSNIHTRISLFRLFIFYLPLLNKSFYKNISSFNKPTTFKKRDVHLQREEYKKILFHNLLNSENMFSVMMMYSLRFWKFIRMAE